jgi:hypothetical protein
MANDHVRVACSVEESATCPAITDRAPSAQPKITTLPGPEEVVHLESVLKQ